MTLPTQQASLAWTYHTHNATLDVVFFGSFISPSGWVGWGINPTSAEMTGTRSLIAFPDPNSGQLVLLPYILDPTVKLQKSPLLSRPLDHIHLLSSSATMYGGKLATIHDGAEVEIFASIKLSSNKSKIHIVWNRGVYVQGYSPTIHPTTVNDLSSATTIDLLSGVARHENDLKSLKIIHGVMNAISWGVMLPIGIVTSRYLRHIEALGPTWFYVHAGMQLSGFFIGSIGFAIGMRLGELSPGKVYGLHRKLGIIAVCLGSLQTLALLFRPKTTNKYRKYWKSYHHFVGYACVVIGVINVFQGFEAIEANRSYAKLAYCLCLSSLIGVCIALEVNSWVIFCRKAEEEKLRRDGVIAGSEKASGSFN
ncbi:hypothetical protein BVRB_9g204760 [Beta vulgaris subsp. vulgaris]|uniref:Cytochrome b561 and DOMON domain-containing protein n=2 Tax=Beta vulgaris subsp. vulgaris TaxID=3555 RepID=A0A0J8BLY5_BETVV|nr:hypothetical protein BVRB_9g204760 [Beta vulgaris subsp. vulgaris]